MEMDRLIIHVRFSPDGTVVEIGERPTELVAQDWFNYLSDKAAAHYQALAGGRGVFRLTRGQLNALKLARAA